MRLSLPPRPLPTVRVFLLWLVLACLLPGMLGASALLAHQYQQTHAQIGQTTVLTARALTQAVDNHLLMAQAVALMLANDPALQSADLALFHSRARGAIARVGLNANVVLRNETGAQLLNTAVDYEGFVPPIPTPERVRPVFDTARPVVNDLFLGPVLRQWVASVEVPVFQAGRVRYALGVGILADEIGELLQRQSLPADWLAIVVDRKGTIVARTHSPERFVGGPVSETLRKQMQAQPEGQGEGPTLEGQYVQAFFSRSPVTGWTVAIGIPRAVADSAFVETASSMVAGIALLFALGMVVAWRIGDRITRAFRALSEGAIQLGAGRAVTLPRPTIHEAGEVGEALLRASALLQERADTLRASQARFRDLADNIAQLAWMADREGHIQWFNQRWYEFTGATPQTPPQEAWQSSQVPEHAQRVQAKLDRCLQTGTPWEDTFPLRAHDGHARWFLSRAFPMRNGHGQIVSWFGTHTDITDQLQAQQALLEAAQRKDEFIAILAHELRNPLAPVRTAVAILQRTQGLEPAPRRACEVIERQVAHMVRLIDDLLDVSRIARHKMNLQRQRCDLTAIARQAVADYQDTMRAVGLRLTLDAEPEPLWVDGDPARLAQMVINLLSNAKRFTEAGGQVCVRVRSDAVSRMAKVSVIDTGIGIPPQLLAKLFDPMSQGQQDLARSRGGLGLGLALTRGLAQLHGGTVDAYSEGEGRGATFTLSLPLLLDAAPSLLGAAPAVAPAAGVTHGALRVLVIEDNVDAAQSMGELLTLLGHQVRLAYDGEAGLRQAQAERPDAVISDIGLPGAVDGYAVATRLRALPGLSGVRLIALSGYADAPARERARQAGFDAHIAKPADLSLLEAALRA